MDSLDARTAAVAAEVASTAATVPGAGAEKMAPGLGSEHTSPTTFDDNDDQDAGGKAARVRRVLAWKAKSPAVASSAEALLEALLSVPVPSTRTRAALTAHRRDESTTASAFLYSWDIAAGVAIDAADKWHAFFADATLASVLSDIGFGVGIDFGLRSGVSANATEAHLDALLDTAWTCLARRYPQRVCATWFGAARKDDAVSAAAIVARTKRGEADVAQCAADAVLGALLKAYDACRDAEHADADFSATDAEGNDLYLQDVLLENGAAALRGIASHVALARVSATRQHYVATVVRATSARPVLLTAVDMAAGDAGAMGPCPFFSPLLVRRLPPRLALDLGD